MTETKNTTGAEVGELTPAGTRYLPHSGGSMGWVDNSLVPKSERYNNYQFHTVHDPEVVRKKQFERWGEMRNRRTEDRSKVPDVGITIVKGRTKYTAVTKDLSPHGMQVQFLKEVDLTKGERVNVQIHDSSGKKVVLEVSAQVMWMDQSGKLRSVWNTGVSFLDVTAEQQALMAGLLNTQR
jgi:hypothetical protein